MKNNNNASRTVVFCTAFVHDAKDPYYSWDVRYRIWVEAVRKSGLEFDQIVLVDDGSATLPNWEDLTILHENDNLKSDAPLVIHHFTHRLGRNAISDFPGWVRSFFFMSYYAKINGFSKIIHLEADAFLITPRACDQVNKFQDGWTAFWCQKFNRPESGIQIIAGSGLETYAKWAAKPVDYFTNLVIEKTLPFSNICRDLIGDRYGEEKDNIVPKNADWCMQAHPLASKDYEGYFWWMPWFSVTFPGLKTEGIKVELIEDASTKLSHGGIYYLNWLKKACEILNPKMYFEIGTHAGDSLKMISCDAVCVDPNFTISTNVLLKRRSTHFFQVTSDEFFADSGSLERYFPSGIDLAFLDGLHIFEALLRDFIGTERQTNPQSMIILHDCLPLNARMAERIRRHGDSSEPQIIRDFWTGDVWKLPLILKKYRPELTISYLDCGPTGLVICTGLDRNNKILSDNYDEIVQGFEFAELTRAMLKNLWELFPTYNSGQSVTNSASFKKTFYE